MKAQIKAFGHELSVKPAEPTQQDLKKSQVDEQSIRDAVTILKKYQSGKAALDEKLIQNDQWYKSQHWDIIRQKQKSGEPEPVTAYLFNTIANKHADAMDNFPSPNIIEREEMDVKEALSLSKILPLVLDKNKFRKTYNRAWWTKLKNGFAIYGVFWDQELENGLGDISIKRLDPLMVQWEPGVEDVQQSRNLFILSLVDNDILEEQYPHLKGKLQADASLSVKQYIHDDTIDISEKSVVVDWYYKKRNSSGQMTLCMTKFVGDNKLDSTEDDEEMSETGLYDHGLYPVFIDVLFPEEGTPTGFGFVDIVKNPQMYIDKLDQIISKNALVAGKQRWLVKQSGFVNETELLDLSKDIVHCEGSIDEANIKAFQGQPLHPFIVQHRQEKIGELKEISAANDFNRGEGGKGVTAASAIQALQEAGNKISRDMISSSYDTYAEMIYMCVELIRQFYDEARKFRIEGQGGEAEYVAYSNQNLKSQQLPPAFEGEGMVENPEYDPMDPNAQQMIQDPNQIKYRKPIFDIKIKPERTSPFSRAAMNEMAKELYTIGLFNPAQAESALIALEMMDFEGKEKIMAKISDLAMMANKLAEMEMTMQKMAAVIQGTTGRNVLEDPAAAAMNMIQNGGPA